jgi:peptidoglycan/xylan/chitin deacetylase (PgdA/CDA1 family)
METSNDDGGDPAAATFAKTFLFFLLLLPIASYRPQKKPPLLLGHASAQPVKKAHATAQVKPKKKKKKLYLTFDDGPNRGTGNVLHIVEDEHVPVSFFIVGEHVFASAVQAQLWDSLQTARQIELCNHSYSHANNHYEHYYQAPDSVVSDFERTRDSLHLNNSIGRTPGRNIWRIDTLRFTDLKKSTAAADSLQQAGFVLMGWDLEWHFDPKTMNVTISAAELVNQIDSMFRHNHTRNKDNLVVLAHDQAYQKSDDSLQLRELFQLLKQKDEYELSLVSDYPGATRKIPDSLARK